MIPDCIDCEGTGSAMKDSVSAPRGSVCLRCGGSGVEPLLRPDPQSIDGDDGQELPEWLTSTHAECPDPSMLGKLLDPVGVLIEWPCGLRMSRTFNTSADRDLNFQALHDEALARAEAELRLQRGVVTMRASRISSGPLASGGIVSSGGFAAPMAPTYDFPSIGGEAGAEAIIPTVKKGTISIDMEVTDASWIKALWERGAISHREAGRRIGR